MKRLFLLGACVLIGSSLLACGKDKEPIATEVPVTEAPTEVVITETPIATDEVVITETPSPEATESNTSIPENASPTAIPLDFQKEGWISKSEAVTLLKMFMGTHDDSGNEFNFDHVSTISQDDKYYYNFKITSGNGTSNQSNFGNYIVSTDGIDILEYTTE